MDKIYALMLKNPPKKIPTYVIAGEDGYPYMSYSFSRSCYSYSLDLIKEKIDIYDRLNMWIPQEGFTRENIQIVEITLNFTPVEE